MRAALAHSDLSAKEIWDRLKGEPQRATTTLDRWKSHGIPRTAMPATVEQLAELCDLPVAFFYADFSRLREIVPTNGAATTERELDRAEAERGLAEVPDRAGRRPESDRQRGRGHRRAGGQGGST